MDGFPTEVLATAGPRGGRKEDEDEKADHSRNHQ